jgi:5-dehydro-2-deoxygluconokinase
MPDSAAMSRKLDFIAMGRAAVDLYGEQIGARLEDMSSFAKYLGGCPANISTGAARLGLKPAMLTRVGDEHMGRFVRETLAAEGVDVSHVRTDPKRLTGLVILGIKDTDTFPLIFFRENCADMAIAPEDFDAAFIASAKALIVTGTHFSTPSTDKACRTAIAYAKAAGTKVVLDIDYRPVLWGLTSPGMGEQRFVASDNVSKHIQSIVAECDLMVGTEEEVHIAGGSTDTLTALRKLRSLSKATIVLKRGAKGCAVFTGPIPASIDDAITHPGFPVDVFNVLGAGDGFMAGLLRGWLRDEPWETACAFANACGALVVSRHGCAPAMPSWTELSDFLGRAESVTKLYADPLVAHLHRTTTGRKAWPEIQALAFDHRRQFEDLAERHKQPPARIDRFKAIVADVVKSTLGGVPGAGAIVDDRFGRDPLYALTGTGIWLARPIELPGANPLAFEGGPDPALTLRMWPAEHVVKCLVTYHPDDPPAQREAQEAQVAKLFRACVGTGHELLLEIIPTRRGGDEGLARSLTRFYDLGIKPDWWKLPPGANGAAWKAIGDVIRARDPQCRGILILGIDSSEEDLSRAFAAATAEPLVRGFAVGRYIFWDTAEAWFAGKIDDRAAGAEIARRYQHVSSLWQARHKSKVSSK